jgi:hypothetical protein
VGKEQCSEGNLGQDNIWKGRIRKEKERKDEQGMGKEE